MIEELVMRVRLVFQLGAFWNQDEESDLIRRFELRIKPIWVLFILEFCCYEVWQPF